MYLPPAYSCCLSWTGIITLLLTKEHRLCGFPWFTACSFLLEGSRPGYCITLGRHFSAGSSGLFFWWPWRCWGVLVRDIARFSSIGICLMFFLCLGWDYRFWKCIFDILVGSFLLKCTFWGKTSCISCFQCFSLSWISLPVLTWRIS